jgi:Tfp pilus assembly protein PilW
MFTIPLNTESAKSNSRVRAACKRVRRGLGLVEAMISLSIAAMLLTAAGAAFNASSKAIEENDKVFRAAQAARVSMNRMLSQCRRGTVLTNSTSSSLNFNTDQMQEVSYKFNSALNQLQFVTNGDLTDPDYVLARNVSSCTFQYTYGTNPALPTEQCVSRVAITINVTCGANTITLTGSAAPRAMLSF